MVDQYGNVQLNIGPDDLADWGDPFGLVIDTTAVTVPLRGAYRDIGTGEVGAVVDSSGLISLAVNGGSAAEHLGISASDELRIERVDAGARADVSTAVSLSRKGVDPTSVVREGGA